MTAGLAGHPQTDAALIRQSLAEPEQFGAIFEQARLDRAAHGTPILRWRAPRRR